MGPQLVLIGGVILGVGILVTLWERMGLPRLPGDLLIQKGNVTFYAPFMTMLLVSVVLTVLLNLFRK